MKRKDGGSNLVVIWEGRVANVVEKRWFYACNYGDGLAMADGGRLMDFQLANNFETNYKYNSPLEIAAS